SNPKHQRLASKSRKSKVLAYRARPVERGVFDFPTFDSSTGPAREFSWHGVSANSRRRMDPRKQIYKIMLMNQGKVYEIYAKSISQGSLFGFVEVEGLIFGEKTTVVVDPSEEALQREFAGVERTYVPMHAVIRIDEVQKRGASRIHSVADPGKVTP